MAHFVGYTTENMSAQYRVKKKPTVLIEFSRIELNKTKKS